MESGRLLAQICYLVVCISVMEGSLPLMGDEADRSMMKEEKLADFRRARPVAGCEFDNQFYGLSETWSPTLDPTEGPHNCIVCHCYPYLDKLRGLHARVVCRNIQSECPAMGNCKIPRDMGGQCCKLCPGQEFNAEMALYRLAGLERRGPSLIGGRLSRGRLTSLGSFGNSDASQSDGGKHMTSAPKETGSKQRDQSEAFKQDDGMASQLPSDVMASSDNRLSADANIGQPVHDEHSFLALLTGVSGVTNTLTSAVARGHFSLVDNGLNYCITYAGVSEPRYVRIVETVGKILFEKSARITDPVENKICGTWYHVTPQVMELLLHNQLHVVLTTSEEKDGIGGDIVTLRGQETFSSILQPEAKDGGGAVAMVTMDITKHDLGLVIRYSPEDLFKGVEGRVRVRLLRGRRKLASIWTTIDYNKQQLRGVWRKMTKRAGRLLPRGGVQLQLATPSGNYGGYVQPRPTCDTLSTVLSGEALSTALQGASGSIQFRLLPGGYLGYQASVSEVGDILPHVTLIKRRRRSPRVVCDIGELVPSSRSGTSKTNGTCGRLNSRQTHWLLHGDLEVWVTSQGHNDVILAGHVGSQRYNPRIQHNTDPVILLSGGFFIPPISTPAAAHAWIHVDHRCRFHYEITVSNSGEHGSFAGRIYYDDEETLLLEPFRGKSNRGTLSDLPETFYDDLERGRVQIRLVTETHPHGLLGAKLKKSTHCSSVDYTEEMTNEDGYLEDQQMEVQRLHLVGVKDTSCRHGSLLHEDGDTWVPLHEDMSKCRTCHCKAGETVCHDTICPVPECDNPISIPGECCPQCPERLSAGKMCFFDADKRNHTRGSSWHPYVPPFGYQACALCHCDESSDGVTCARKSCPELDCAVEDRIRPSETDCCQVCADGAPKLSTRLQSDGVPQEPEVPDGGCLFRGDVYTAGESWHPRVPPFGEIYCIDCTCEAGESRCTRQSCPTLSCSKRKKLPKTCCEVCEDE